MSNGTPAAIRTKDKERKAQEKHPKQISKERKARFSSGVKAFWTVFTVVFVILGAVLTLQYFSSARLTLAPVDTARPNDPMGTVFSVTNGGMFPVYDVEQTCVVDIKPSLPGIGIRMRPLGTIGAGDTKTLNCQHAASGFNRQTSMTIAIEYRPLFWPWKITKPFPLESEMKPDGTWYWKLV
jgi:hypothetical protein